jgi:hypothetical protein
MAVKNSEILDITVVCLSALLAKKRLLVCSSVELLLLLQIKNRFKYSKTKFEERLNIK